MTQQQRSQEQQAQQPQQEQRGSHPESPWLRGPVAGIAPGLQPVAHALIAAMEEAAEFVADFPDERLWDEPAGLASVGFHLTHIPGSLDRLFTYARGEPLSDEQRAALSKERSGPDLGVTTDELLARLTDRLQAAVKELEGYGADELHQERLIGSKKIPSTVQGALFHAAEHTQRHIGQLLVTARVVAAGRS